MKKNLGRRSATVSWVTIFRLLKPRPPTNVDSSSATFEPAGSVFNLFSAICPIGVTASDNQLTRGGCGFNDLKIVTQLASVGRNSR